jgi:hypothetical protein
MTNAARGRGGDRDEPVAVRFDATAPVRQNPRASHTCGSCGRSADDDSRPWLLITGWRDRMPVSVLACPDCEDSMAYPGDELHDLIGVRLTDNTDASIDVAFGDWPTSPGVPVMIERHSPVGESGYFASSAEYGLYLKALDWCLREAGRYLPAEWVIPEWVITGWGQRRTANQLAATGIWEHDPYEHVYRFRYVYRRNTPESLRQTRTKGREKKARQRVARANVPRGQMAMSPGDSPEDNRCVGEPEEGRHVQKKTL